MVNERNYDLAYIQKNGGLCYSGDELFQIREQTEEQPILGLVRWKRYQRCAFHGAFQANSSGPPTYM